MKIVGLELKKITIGKFFPREDKVELDILFNDGADKEIFNVVNASDPQNSAENILIDLRKLENTIHKNYGGEFIVNNVVNIVIKEEDRLVKEISQFIQQIRNKMNDIKNKNVAEGHLDRVRELKKLKIEF